MIHLSFSRHRRHAVLMKRALQAVVAVGSLVPVGAGVLGIIRGLDFIQPTAMVTVSVDSHFRYLSGVLLALGLGFLSTIPHIENKSERFLMLAAIVFIGGLGRLYAWWVLGSPDLHMQFGLGMELVVTPLLVLWQRAVARSFG
jgi:hypothetical protein